MKNFPPILVLLFLIAFSKEAFSQSKMIMGGGVINSIIEVSTNSSWQQDAQRNIKPFVGFTYEYNFNKGLFLSANLNYSKNDTESYSFNNTPADFFFPPKIKFVQISVGTSINYKIFSSITKSEFWQGFNTGIGFNIDNLRDFKDDSFGFITLDPDQKNNQYQLGLLYHLSWDHKKFRLTYNFANGVTMFGNQRDIVDSIDWRTLSASYIYTFSD